MDIPNCLLTVNHLSLENIIIDFLKDKTNKNYEIEARLGRIISKITNQRISYYTAHPVIFNKVPSEMKFISGVDADHHKLLQKNLFGDKYDEINLERKYEDHTEISNKVRRIKIISENNENILYQEKIRLHDITIYLPNNIYDVRLSISQEINVDSSKFVPQNISIKRTRKRNSYLCKDYSFDFTIVKNEYKNQKEDDALKTYEAEIEVLNKEFDKSEFVKMILNFSYVKRKDKN